MSTSFQDIEDLFLNKITDDMYMELTEEETIGMLNEILLAALPYFEFPAQDIMGNVDVEDESFSLDLSYEEQNNLATYMVVTGIGFQLANVDLIRQKYSGSDFSFTSQASHMKQLNNLREQYKQEGFHLQRLYNRREKKLDGSIGSTFWKLRKEGTIRE